MSASLPSQVEMTTCCPDGEIADHAATGLEAYTPTTVTTLATWKRSRTPV